MGVYPEAARAVLEKCVEYRDGKISLAAFKSTVWDLAEEVVAVDERPLRDFLQRAEGRLDMIEHTTSDDALFEATLPVVGEIEDRLHEYVSSGG